MHDEQMTEEKKKIIHLLLSRMTGRFYPLACQSFAVPDMTVDRAVTAMARKKNLPWADNKKVRNSVIRKYVHFRLELASLMVKSDSRCSDFLAETVKDSLDFDITRSFSGEFDSVRRALLPFKSPFAMESGMVIPLITYLSAETGVSLSPLTDYLMKETEEYMARVKEESASFMDALSFCNPDFHDTTALKLPFLLLQCICENLGMEEGGLVTESAQILMPLSEVTPYMAKKKLTPAGARFFYHYIVFRAMVLSFFGSYMYQDRKLRDSIYKGVMKSRPVMRLIRTARAIHFLADEDFIMNQRLYLKINMFMRQWAIFDPKRKEHYYRYYPNFTSYIGDRMEDESFGDRINLLLDEFCQADRFTLSERDRNFLLQETAAYINTVSHAMYFAYNIGFRRPEDFIDSRWNERTKNPLLKGFKKIFGL